MEEIGAVLFDFGDTLFERAGGHTAVVRAAAELGTELDDRAAFALWRTIQSQARTPAELARGRDLSPEAHRRCWTELYRAADVVAPGMAQLLYGYEVNPASWKPFPEVAEVLAQLRGAGLRVGVVSDTGWDIRAVFDAHGLTEFVEVFVLSCEHGVAKPAPALFDAACCALGVSPAETLMVGDNPLTDGGALDSGMACVVVPPPSCRPPWTLTAVTAFTARSRWSTAVRAVLLDWRETLVFDPDDTWWVRTAARRIGRELSDEAVAEMVRALQAASRAPEVQQAQLTADCAPDLHRSTNMMLMRAAGLDQTMATALYDLDFDMSAHPLNPDVPMVLRELKERDVAVAVVSDIHFDLRPEFARHGLRDLIDAYVLSFEVGAQKPDPAIFRAALDGVGVGPHEAIMLGDNPLRDGAAAELGILTLLLPPARAAGEHGLKLITKLLR
jgi:HAD superfamily hydrolase (TIGR01509 family)